jgi:hypothetical protein
MKKEIKWAIIAMVLVAVPFKGSAQLESKKFFVSGSAYIISEQSATTSGSTTTYNPSSLRVGFTPAAGYMLNDKWALLMELGYSSTITDNKKTGDANLVKATPRFSISAGVRRYLMLNERAGFFIDGKLGAIFSSQQTQQNNTVTSYSTNGFFGLVEPGIAFFITDRLMMTGQFGGLEFYSRTENTSSDTKKTTNTFALVLEPSAVTGLGLSFFF